MTTEQIIIFAILAVAMGLFLWGRWRYDLVALIALLAGVFTGVVPAGDAFAGFGNPAVITVAAVLVISRALQISGLIDRIGAVIADQAKSLMTQITVLGGLGGVLSAFMNNVGALALLLPIALKTAERPSRVLMPLSFCSILGGLVTLIGTPPNIIVANYRGSLTGEPFGMFDFTPVGLPVALLGLAFVVLVGWRLIPKARQGRKAAEDLFEIRDYIAELQVSPDSEMIGQPVSAVEALSKGEAIVVGLRRGERRRLTQLARERLQEGDVVLLRAEAQTLDKLAETAHLALSSGEELSEGSLRSEQVGLIEAVIPPTSRIVGLTPNWLGLRRRYGVALLALARQGGAVTQGIANTRLRAGDVLLLQGELEDLPDAVSRLGCLPLAGRGLSLGRPRRLWLPLAIFVTSVLMTAFGLFPVQITFTAAVAALILLNRISPREAYESVDWPVLVLLGAMIPLGQALEASGGTGLIAGAIVSVAPQAPAIFVLALVMVVTMTLSDLMNNAATAIVMAPIGAGIAEALGASADPFLMAVALGASCAFLTPIGHQNNVLVMGPGGYRFGDYWRMGLPLEVLIVVASLPLILFFWPL